MGTKHSHVILDLGDGKVLPSALALPAEGASSVVWKELVLHRGQLLDGAAGCILQAELLSILINPTPGDTLICRNKTAAPTIETFTFRVALAAPFDVLIGINVAATMANLVTALNTDSTLWKGILVAGLDKWFASSPAAQVIVARKAYSADPDRLYGTLTAPASIKVVSFSDTHGYEKTYSVEANLPAVDPAAKRFGFGREYAALTANEWHGIAEINESYAWDSDDEVWQQTAASAIHALGGAAHSADTIVNVEGKLSDLAGRHIVVTQSSANKEMACLVTVADGNPATASAVATTPVNDGYIQVLVNGVQVSVGDAVKTKDCYFSGDAGATARAIAAIVAGDTCHWVGSVAGYQLAITDVMTWNYLV